MRRRVGLTLAAALAGVAMQAQANTADAAAAHMGRPAKAPDLRAQVRSLVYAALTEPKR